MFRKTSLIMLLYKINGSSVLTDGKETVHVLLEM